MNARLTSVLILAAALSASALIPLLAASPNDNQLVYPVHKLIDSTDASVKIERGAAKEYVSWAMRNKTCQELSPDVWAFFGPHAQIDSDNDEGCRTLIITFSSGKVADMRLVNKSAFTAIASSLRLGSLPGNIASK